MPLVKATCTNCGAVLEVDPKKDAAICPFCNTAYIVEKAIHNYAGNHYGTINASVVNFYNGSGPQPSRDGNPNRVVPNIKPNESVLRGIKLADRLTKQLYFDWGGGYVNIIFLKSDGTLGLGQTGYFERVEVDPSIFTWKNIKSFLLPKAVGNRCNNWSEIIAVTFAGRCLVSSKGEYDSIRNWTGISQIEFCSGLSPQDARPYVIGLKDNGTVVSTPELPDLASWTGIRRLYSFPGIIAGITYDGEVRITGAIKSYQREIIFNWRSISQLSEFDKEIYGITFTGNVVSSAFDKHDFSSLRSVVKIDSGCVFLSNGALLPLPNASRKIAKAWLLGEGYIQACKSDDYDERMCLFLTEGGRVDQIKSVYVGGVDIEREIRTDVIALVNLCSDLLRGGIGYGCILRDGSIQIQGTNLNRMFVDNAIKYGKGVTSKVPDPVTRRTLTDTYHSHIKAVQEDLNRLEQNPRLGSRNWRREYKLEQGKIIKSWEERLRIAQAIE